jgi:hypothetical protein
MELLQSIETAIRNYFSSLKILEEFGQENTKATTQPAMSEENEGSETIEESKSDETPNPQTSKFFICLFVSCILIYLDSF